MYPALLAAHSWLRWLVIIGGIGAVIAAARDRTGPGTAGAADRWGLLYMMSLDVQLLIGLLLYLVVSPNMEAIRQHFSEAMQVPVARFWAVEHIGTMIVAVVLVHVGRVLARNAKTPSSKRTRLVLCFGLALIGILFATPWPGTVAGRPLFRI